MNPTAHSRLGKAQLAPPGCCLWQGMKSMCSPRRLLFTLLSCTLPLVLPAHAKGENPPKPGDHTRTLRWATSSGSYLVHVPQKYDPREADARGAGPARGRDERPDHGCVLRPEQEVRRGRFHRRLPKWHGAGGASCLTWNAGGFRGKEGRGKADDVAFVGKLLDDLATVVNVDPKRVYATGMSNGGMMCYRLAAELSGPHRRHRSGGWHDGDCHATIPSGPCR